jgi:hypothetical protein
MPQRTPRRVQLENVMRLKLEAGVSPARARAEYVVARSALWLLLAEFVLMFVGIFGAPFVVPSDAVGFVIVLLIVIVMALLAGTVALLVVGYMRSERVIDTVRWQDATITLRTVEPGQVSESGQSVECEVELRPTGRVAYDAGQRPAERIVRVSTEVGPLDIQSFVVGTTMRCQIDRSEQFFLRAFPNVASSAPLSSGRSLKFQRA